ncbi:hypothetical protein J2X19_003463 [Rhodoferax ferrireducens]|uniref:Transposase n=1 Tax=Rhodoferax ferrireducens TaxID=192843 RepID=A0ABU2CBT3_9BURK|nr:hypothetical protein [Rhodoferax ferrireducens]MDR7378769.1 hypothetical protein [Rhodoferax ferrireducens]
MRQFDPLCIHPPSGHSMGVDGGLYGIVPAMRKNRFGAVRRQHFLAGEEEVWVLVACNRRSSAARRGKDIQVRIAETPLRFKSVPIDFATEYLGARRTHAVRTARHAAAPTSNRSLGLKQR